jgi:hypothetical protein
MENFNKDFPILESYRNAAGKSIEFSINAEDLHIGIRTLDHVRRGCETTSIDVPPENWLSMLLPIL